MTVSDWTTLPPNPRDVCTCEHPRSTHGEQREGPYCSGGQGDEPICTCSGFAFKRLTRLEQIRWEHERAAEYDPAFSALTATGVLLAEIDRLTADVAHRRQQNRELAAMEENARKQHRALADRISEMATCWEQQLPDTIRTAAVVSALRAAVETHR